MACEEAPTFRRKLETALIFKIPKDQGGGNNMCLVFKGGDRGRHEDPLQMPKSFGARFSEGGPRRRKYLNRLCFSKAMRSVGVQ